MITSGLILIGLYFLLMYAFECIKYFNKIDDRFGNSLWRWSYDYPVKGKQDISNIDDIEIETGEEVVRDDDPILDISKEDKDNDGEVEIEIQDDISFIGEDEIGEEDDLGDDDVSVEVIDDNKD